MRTLRAPHPRVLVTAVRDNRIAMLDVAPVIEAHNRFARLLAA